MSELAPIPVGHGALLAEIKQRVAAARTRAVLADNAEQIALSHDIGRELLARREAEAWGAKVIDRLAGDLREAFPDMRGFSPSNLKYMRFFAEHCPLRQFGQQRADQLPWFHVVQVLTKLATPELRVWYALHGIDKPIGVAECQLTRALPQPLDTNLPSIEVLEDALSRGLGGDEEPRS